MAYFGIDDWPGGISAVPGRRLDPSSWRTEYVSRTNLLACVSSLPAGPTERQKGADFLNVRKTVEETSGDYDDARSEGRLRFPPLRLLPFLHLPSARIFFRRLVAFPVPRQRSRFPLGSLDRQDFQRPSRSRSVRSPRRLGASRQRGR